MVKKHKNQMALFQTVVKSASLISDSPKRAFYRIRIEEDLGNVAVIKESGANDKVLDCRRWEMPDMASAEKFFDKKIKEKKSKKRKRIYKNDNKTD